MDRIRAVLNYLGRREPLVLVNAAAGVLTAVIVEVRDWVETAQGGLEGEHAWFAVAWAALVWASRHVVSPASPAGIRRSRQGSPEA